MLNTNLLPAQEKKNFVYEQWRRLILVLGGALAVGLAIGIVFVTPSYLPLFFQQRELERRLEIEQSAYQALRPRETEEQAKTIDLRVRKLKNAGAKPPAASRIFKTLLSGTASGITISSFSVEKNRNLALAGQASTRQDLLNFEQTLRASGRFEEIASPLSDIIQERAINFSMRGRAKPEYGL